MQPIPELDMAKNCPPSRTSGKQWINDNYDIDYDENWKWVAAGITWGIALVYMLLVAFVASRVTHVASGTALRFKNKETLLGAQATGRSEINLFFFF